MLSRRAQTFLPHRRVDWRNLSTEVETGDGLHSRGISRRNLDGGPRPSRRGTATRSIFIRPWDGINSTAEAFAIIRGVERKYGRIREFKFMRDFEMPERYQQFFWANFSDVNSFSLVPEAGEAFKVTAPPLAPQQPGGIGLEDLAGLMEPQNRVDEDETPDWDSLLSKAAEVTQKEDNSVRIIDVRVERGDTDYRYQGDNDPILLSRNIKLAVGHAFVKWGGFAKLEPLKSSPFTSDGAPPIDKQRMRTVLTKWSSIVGVPDPSIFARNTPRLEQPQEAVASSQSPSVVESLPREVSPPPPKQPNAPPPSTWEPLPTPVKRTPVQAPPEGRPPVESPSPVHSVETSERKPRERVLTKRQRLLNRLAEEPAEEAEGSEKTESKPKRERRPPVEKSLTDRLWVLIGGKKWF